jgi:hypothetical protein
MTGCHIFDGVPYGLEEGHLASRDPPWAAPFEYFADLRQGLRRPPFEL